MLLTCHVVMNSKSSFRNVEAAISRTSRDNALRNGRSPRTVCCVLDTTCPISKVLRLLLSCIPCRNNRRIRAPQNRGRSHFGTLVWRFATQSWLISAAFIAIPCVAQSSGIVYSTTVPYTGNRETSGYNIFPAPTVELLVTDASGNTYVVGAVTSNGLPATPGVVQPDYGGGTFNSGDIFGSPSPNVFLAKFDSNGKLFFLTYLGGATINVPYGLAVDKSGNIYLGVEAGFSYIQQGPSYVAKVSADGTALGWVTFLTGGPLLQMAMAPDGSLYCLTQDALAFTATLTKLSEGGDLWRLSLCHLVPKRLRWVPMDPCTSVDRARSPPLRAISSRK